MWGGPPISKWSVSWLALTEAQYSAVWMHQTLVSQAPGSGRLGLI